MSLFSSFQIHAVTAFHLAPATILPNQGWSFLPILHIKYSGRRVKLLPGEVLNARALSSGRVPKVLTY